MRARAVELNGLTKAFGDFIAVDYLNAVASPVKCPPCSEVLDLDGGRHRCYRPTFH